MATRGGYRICEEDRRNIHSKDLCGICKNVLKTAIQTECGHRYCRDCLEEEFSKYNHGIIECRVCKEYLTKAEIFRDKSADRAVQSLILHCINCTLGCEWCGQLKHRQEHEDSHLNLTLRNSKILNETNQEIKEIKETVEFLCFHSEPFKAYSEVQEHKKKKECVQIQDIYPIQEEDNGGYWTDDSLVWKTDGVAQRQAEVPATTKENSDAKIKNLASLLNEAQNTIADLQQELITVKCEEFKAMMESHLEEQENTARMCGDATRRQLSFNSPPYYTDPKVTGGIMVWKIDQVAQRHGTARSGSQVWFYSPPFYTSPHGYKMCACIFLDGYGVGKGTHISLFFAIMQGEYDPQLKWPFSRKVTMILLDQDMDEHVIEAFRPDPNRSSFQKPRGAMNIASGCPMFCPHSELQRHAYIRKDVMFIKIIVDQPHWR